MFDQLVGLLLVGLGLRNPVTGNVAGKNTEVVETQQDNRGRAGETRIELRDDRKDTRASRAADIRERRDAFHEELKEKREAAKEAFKEEREQFKEKLESLRDERKKSIVERVDERMSRVNEHRTDQMTKHLEKMNSILERVVSRTAEAAAVGKDTSSVDSAIAEAQAVIGAAQDAVAAQAGKDYVIEITSEDGLKNVVGSAMSSLQSDLRSVHGLIVEARKKVSAAIQALAHILGKGGLAPTGGATPSATLTPTP